MQLSHHVSQFVRVLLYAGIGFGFGVLEHFWPLEQFLPWQNAFIPFLCWGLPVIFIGWYEHERTARWCAIYLGILSFWLFALAGFYIYELVWYQVVQPVWMNVPWPYYVAQAGNQFLEWTFVALFAGAILSTVISILGSLQQGSFIPRLSKIVSVAQKPCYGIALCFGVLFATVFFWIIAPLWQDWLLDSSWLSPVMSRFR